MEIIEDKKVMIVDNLISVAEVFKKVLVNMGYIPMVVTSGLEAITEYKNKYDNIGMIFMRNDMLEADKYQTTQEIRKFEKKSSIEQVPIIGFLAKNFLDFKKYGLSDIMDIPVNREDLNNILSKYNIN